MAQRPLLKADHWATLLGAPSDEETLIRHYTLGQADLHLIRAKTTAHNQLGLAIQLCLMRHLGRSWRHDEVPPAALVTFIAHQIDVPSMALRDYGRRGQNRREHALEVQRHLGLRQVDKHDLRAALGAALEAADATDHGQPIAEAKLATLRERRTLLPATDTLDRLGRGARAIARRRMEAALVAGLTAAELAALDDLLVLDPAVPNVVLDINRGHTGSNSTGETLYSSVGSAIFPRGRILQGDDDQTDLAYVQLNGLGQSGRPLSKPAEYALSLSRGDHRPGGLQCGNGSGYIGLSEASFLS